MDNRWEILDKEKSGKLDKNLKGIPLLGSI